MATRTGLRDRRRQGRGIGIAHVDQFAALGMPADGVEVVAGDSAATGECEPDLPVGNGGTMSVHGGQSFGRM